METGDDNFHHTVAGGWLGSYYYDHDAQPPTRFEATFGAVASASGAFNGTILDDGPLGEARAEGTQTGRAVSFVKAYVKPPRGYAVAPILYVGALSDDGKMMTGTWELATEQSAKRSGGRRRSGGALVRGLWEARRMWSEEIEEAGAGEAFERELVGGARR